MIIIYQHTIKHYTMIIEGNTSNGSLLTDLNTILFFIISCIL